MSDKQVEQCMVLDSDNVVCFDVDDTLILWDVNVSPDTLNELASKSEVLTIGTTKAYANAPVIEELKRHKARGHFVIVWSQGGYQWAARAVAALGLQHEVDIAMSKPKWLWDDKPATSWSTMFYKNYLR